MKVKVWYCFGNQCITPCILPYDDDHDTPDNCYWSGESSFETKEIEITELLSQFMDIGEYASVILGCEASKGICHKEGKCTEKCTYAEKYEETKKLFEEARKCEYRNDDICNKNNKECVASECKVILV